jgi:hypothetical protein
MKAMAAMSVYTLILPVCAIVGAHATMKYLEKVIYHLSWLLTMMGFDLAKKRTF